MKKIEELKLTKVKIDDLNQHPHNPNQGDVGAIVESLEAHGYYKPVVVQKSSMNVLAGNHTIQAARIAGLKEVQVIIHDIDDEQALRLMLVDNESAKKSSYDKKVLTDVLESLVFTDFGLGGTGFDGDYLDDLVTEFQPAVPPADFPSFDEDTQTAFQCPKCHYEWNGSPR